MNVMMTVSFAIVLVNDTLAVSGNAMPSSANDCELDNPVIVRTRNNSEIDACRETLAGPLTVETRWHCLLEKCLNFSAQNIINRDIIDTFFFNLPT